MVVDSGSGYRLKMITCCEKTIKIYIDEPVREVKELTGGHINRTFLVKAGSTYVLQSLNPCLYSAALKDIEYNYMQYKSACELHDAGTYEWYCPEWVKNREGNYFYMDDAGKIWRMYRYIEGSVFDKEESETGIYEVGKGLGRLHRILNECDSIREPGAFAHLHDIDYYYKKYLSLHIPDKNKRIDGLDRIIRDRIEEMRAIKVPTGSVIHADAKTGNMVFRNGRVVCFIDTDSIMQGSVYDDLADCARSCCTYENGDTDREKLISLLKGYEDGCKYRINTVNMGLLIKYIAKNRFLLGIRYYSDHLSGEGYFAERYSGQNAEKAGKLLNSFL